MIVLQAILLGIPAGALYGLMGLGISLIFRSTRVMNFSQGNGGMIGAFVAFSVYTLSGSYILALTSGMLTGAAIGITIDQVLMKQSRDLTTASMLIVTLGVLLILEGAAFLIWGTTPQIFPRLYTGSPLIITIGTGSIVLPANDAAITVVALLVATALALFLKFTRFGIGTRARAQDTVGAQAVGISMRAIDAAVWGIGVALSALVGVLVAPRTSVTPGMLVNFQLYGLTAAILGGFSSFFGPIVGGMILGIAEKLIVFGVDGALLRLGIRGVNAADYQLSIILGIIILVLVVRPSGIFAARFTEKV